MKIFLDTIDVDIVKKYSSYNLVDGITTNPTLMSGSSQSFYEIAAGLCQSIKGDVSLEVSATEYDVMMKEAKRISEISSNAIVKLPMTLNGIKTCSALAEKGVGVNMTLCFTPMQALIAAKSGAKYVSPFIGRLEDNGQNGLKLLSDIRNIFDRYNLKTEILAASVRSIDHINGAAIAGADCVTIPPRLMDILISHELTTKGLESFIKDWSSSGKTIL